ncbi:MAG: SO2930 family diheme c-type cytochrome [Flavobacteriaceae bacterium]
MTRTFLKITFSLPFFVLTMGCQNETKKLPPKAKKVNAQKILNRTTYAEKQHLSEYNFFTLPFSNLDPQKNVYPYDLNNALFSDYAFKKRFVYLPNGKKMNYRKDDVFDFEEGSILIKNFYYPQNFNQPKEVIKIIETRLLIKENNKWKPLNYVWNEDQKDAKLNYVGGEVPISWTDSNQSLKTIQYGIPNLNECKNCHLKGTEITPIGPTAAQLNKKYTAIQSTQNQLERFQEIGLIDLPVSHSKIPKLPVWNDPQTGTIEERANAYLYANCAHCHRVDGSAKNSGLYLTFNQTDLRKRGVFKPPVAAGKGSGDLEYSIVPGHPEESILLYRMKSNDPAIRMPEIGRVSAHQEGIVLIEEYIKTLASN